MVKEVGDPKHIICFLISIFLYIDITVPPNHTFKDYLHNVPGISLSFKYVSELKINNIIDKLDTKQSYGFDCIGENGPSCDSFHICARLVECFIVMKVIYIYAHQYGHI